MRVDVRHAAAAALAAGFAWGACGSAIAQQQPLNPFGTSGPTLSQGYVGLSLGRTKFDPDCAPGFGCDSGNTGFKISAGAISEDVFGAEISYVDLGRANVAGGRQDANGVNFSGIATLPFTDALSGHVKLGLTLGRTSTSSSLASVSTGSKTSLSYSYGLGVTFALTRQWAVVAEYERYRFKFTNGSQTLGFTSIGARYRF
ncbi:MAG: outer membrane beta-barrel protein [Lautropia sp.]